MEHTLEIVAENSVTTFRLNGIKAECFVKGIEALKGQRGLCFKGGDSSNGLADELLRHEPVIWDSKKIAGTPFQEEIVVFERKATREDIETWIRNSAKIVRDE